MSCISPAGFLLANFSKQNDTPYLILLLNNGTCCGPIAVVVITIIIITDNFQCAQPYIQSLNLSVYLQKQYNQTATDNKPKYITVYY